jgi:ADP-ribosylglycohydrolase
MGAPRTVVATPLRNSYWVIPGKVLAGEHPGGTTVESTRERLKRLIDAGVECFIDLTEPGELKPYDGELPVSVEYLRKPIKDHSTPSQRVHMAEILDCLHDTLLSGRCVYVHCRAGIGRTGTVVGCFLVERGLAGEAALDELNRLWQQSDRSQSWASVPETDDQIAFVRRWKARGIFNDLGQLAAPRLTADDDEPAVDEGAPWAHLLMDPKSPSGSGSSGPAKTAADQGRKSVTGSPAPGARPTGAAPPTSRRGGAAGAANSPPRPVAPASNRASTQPAAPTPSRTGAASAPATPQAKAASAPSRPAATATPAAPAKLSPTTPASAGPILTDPTSVANVARGPARPPAPPSATALDNDDPDPLLQPEALAAASTLRGRFHGTLLGLAVGDAVAAATQYRRPGSFTPIGDMLGGGPFDLPRGGWSDDTAMALCLADSLLERDSFDARDQMDRYRRWQQEGYLSATGQCVGITASSARAIAMAQWRRQAFSGSHDPAQLDPEPLSRVAAVVLFYFATQGQAIDHATEAARTTCQVPAVLEACRSLARALHAALEGQPRAVVLERAALASGVLPAGVVVPAANPTGSPSRDSGVNPRGVTGAQQANGTAPSGPARADAGTPTRASSSTAPAVLAAAVTAFGATDNFRDAILYAANLGGDSDVVAAVCGQLAGAYYGVRAIPTSWHNSLMRKELIVSYADRLLARAMIGMAG